MARPDPPPPVRTVVTHLAPEVECGRFPAKAIVGDSLSVTARVFADGHDVVRALLEFEEADGRARLLVMEDRGNDVFGASVVPTSLGRARFRVVGYVDDPHTWLDGARKKHAAQSFTALDALEGAVVLEAARDRADARSAGALDRVIAALRQRPPTGAALTRLLRAAEQALGALAAPADATASPWREVWVDPVRAAFSAWYELFPRSAGDPGHHGTLRDVVRRLPYVRALGFDVLYLPPIHPIGHTARKGPNNAAQPAASANVLGSPWAIGSEEGGHTAIHPDLGTLSDFDRLREASEAAGLTLALDLAFQCSPDHPWVREHPEWFRHAPDGTIRHAENPPKRYQDIYPLDLAGEAYGPLWDACLEVVRFWIGHGVKTFRVDNPHTKPFDFWEWLIRAVRADHPDVVFLAEAFTRPAVMYRLAQLGFSQSYTYFAWRTRADEIRDYVRELQSWPVKDFFRPNFWPNTPDILTSFLQTGGPPAFAVRLVVAATLGSSYGVYGPAFEEMEARPLSPAGEEYLDSEKYQLRTWAWDPGRGLGPLIAQLNGLRRAHAALQRFGNVHFHASDNPELLVYSRRDEQSGDTLIMVVNLDPHWTQSGFVSLDLASVGIPGDREYRLRDLMDPAGVVYTWIGPKNFVRLDPRTSCAHILQAESEPGGP
jgi:starch synthase (maltosyl-transferring)